MRYLVIIVLMSVLYSCKKSEDVSIPYYYEYFPLEINAWIDYDVNAIVHTSVGSDTSNYFLHEVVTEEFLDDQGRVSYRIERFWKFAESDPWVIKDVWYANRTTTTAEKVEENIRYNKLVFPITSDKVWNGNAFNNLDDWDYSYDSLHTPKTLNSLSFDSTVTVVQRENINAVEFELAEEIYAKNVGLVCKKFIDYDMNFSLKEGEEFEMIVTAYGK